MSESAVAETPNRVDADPDLEIEFDAEGNEIRTDDPADANGADPWDHDPALDGPADDEPADPEDDEPEDEPELFIDAGGQLTMSVGGKKPTGSSIRLVGGKIDLEGQFSKGKVVKLEIEAQVTSVAFVDKRDAKTGQVSATERQHKATIIGVQRS